MQVNANKYTLCVIKLKFIGYLLMRTSYNMLVKNIKAIFKMALPMNVSKGITVDGTIDIIKNHKLG